MGKKCQWCSQWQENKRKCEKKHIHRRRGQWKILENCIKIIFLFSLPRKSTYNTKPGYIHIITVGTCITGLSLLLGIQWRTPSSSGWRSQLLVLQSWPQGYHAFPFFELWAFSLSIMPRFFSVANPPGFLLLEKPPRSINFSPDFYLLSSTVISPALDNCSGLLFLCSTPVSLFSFDFFFTFFFSFTHLYSYF